MTLCMLDLAFREKWDSREELLKLLRRQGVAKHNLGLCLQFSWLCNPIYNPKTGISFYLLLKASFVCLLLEGRPFEKNQFNALSPLQVINK